MTTTKERNEEKLREMLLYSTPEEIYDKVLSGELNKFPEGFWGMPGNYDYAKRCIKHLIEDILKYPTEEIPTYYTARFLLTYKLGGMLTCVFNSSVFESLECAYPGHFKPYMLKKVPHGYWSPSTVNEAMHWLIDEKLKISEEEFVSNLSARFLTEHNLASLYQFYSLYEILEFTYPGKYKEWDLDLVGSTSALARGEEGRIKDFLLHKIIELDFKPQDYTASTWFLKVRRGFLRKLKYTDVYKMTCEIYYKLDTNSQNKKYDNSTEFLTPPEVIYGALLQGKLSRFPRGYWTEDDALERSARCVKYLVEEVLHLEVSQVPTVLNYSVFREYKLCGMIGLLFSNSYRKAIVNAYPERFELVGSSIRTID